ncbi:MarR family winged helix-turn-helix transcriptional regulator [Dactylosporangium cerinum]|uniref:MarR family winged helix-turn-helix transcriptional regulator n=1 Tax=Dactylosporangium cerinum TaxID=1434730 RepID=A0ABV9W682_9ACTN
MARRARTEVLREVHDGLRSFTAYAVLYSQAVAERLGLSATDSRCVDLLDRHGPMSAGRLAELTGLTSGAVTGIVDRLERARFARREPDPMDRRRVIVHLVPARENDAFAHLASAQDRVDGLLAQYDLKELAAIGDFLAKASATTAEEIARLRP